MNGIVMIVFGMEYDRIASHCFLHTAEVDKVERLPPIKIYTNLKERDRDEAWNKSLAKYDMEFTCWNYETNYNRIVKIMLHETTPFERTLYIDADAIIRKPVDCIFAMLDNADLVMNCIYIWRPGDKVPNIYIKAFKMFNTELPLVVYNGGFFAWKTNDINNSLFNLWLKYWLKTGKGRDMPALNCAIREIKPVIFDVCRAPVFASSTRKDNYIIQHNYNGTFFKDFNLPFYQENKWFDSDPNDFHLSVYE